MYVKLLFHSVKEQRHQNLLRGSLLLLLLLVYRDQCVPSFIQASDWPTWLQRQGHVTACWFVVLLTALKTGLQTVNKWLCFVFCVAFFETAQVNFTTTRACKTCKFGKFLFFSHGQMRQEGVCQCKPMAGITLRCDALGTATPKAIWAHVGKNSWKPLWSSKFPFRIIRNHRKGRGEVLWKCCSDLFPSVRDGVPSRKWENTHGSTAPGLKEWEAVKWR